VLSYWNDANFGDRLGYLIVPKVLPPHALVTYASVKPWTVPDEPFDLLLLGTGNSLNAATVRRDELFRLLDRVPRKIGVFGTQYAHHYVLPQFGGEARFRELLDRLTLWYARYAEDIRRYGGGRSNAVHLGDWLVSAFVLTRWTQRKTLVVPAEIQKMEIAPDRFIQQVQSFRRVKSFRLHPLLCALTSAEQVAYEEQREDGTTRISGKFAAMLDDVFGRAYPEGKFWNVDRAKVAAYKLRVARNMERLAGEIHALLGLPHAASGGAKNPAAAPAEELP
jgi:hypothetical protein